MAIGEDFAGQTNLDPAVHVRIARDRDGAWLAAYTPVRNIMTLDTSGLGGARLRVSFVNPETGIAERDFSIDRDERAMLLPDRDLDSLIVVRAEG